MNDLPVVYSDKSIVVVNKPSGMPSCGGACSAENQLASHLGEIYPVHRLDTDTKGLMVFARTRASAAALSSQMTGQGSSRTVYKEYAAVVLSDMTDFFSENAGKHTCGKDCLVCSGAGRAENLSSGASCADARKGQSEKPEGHDGFLFMSDLLFYDRTKNKSYVVARMRRGVKEALLEYRPEAVCGGMTLVRVILHTGRTHQIRVQLASRGFPIVGDRKYGAPAEISVGTDIKKSVLSGEPSKINTKEDKEPEKTKDNRWESPQKMSLQPYQAFDKPQGIALVCRVLAFRHPETGKMVKFSTGLPEEFPFDIFSPGRQTPGKGELFT